MTAGGLRVFVLGSVNLDIRLGVQRIVAPGETVLTADLGDGIGGKGANQACAVAALGVPATLIGAVGTDQAGELALEYLHSRGVDIDNVARVPGATGRAYIQVQSTGQNAILVSPNANVALTCQTVQDQLERARKGDVLVAQLETPPDVVEQAFVRAHERGLTTVLNPSPAQHLTEVLLRHTDLLVVNELEGAFYSGSDPALAGDRKVLESIAALGPRSVVQTLGDRGAAFLDAEGSFGVSGPASAVVKDTTGAGDAFLGGLVVAMHRTGDFAQACAYANRVAAYCVTQDGPLQRVPAELSEELG